MTVSDYVSALKRCSKTRDLEFGKKIHKDAIITGFHTDKYITAALITMYAKCGCMTFARDIFDTAHKHDVFIWNCLLLGYVENGDSLTTVELFADMDCDPTPVTFVAVLKACGCLAQENISQKNIYLQKLEDVHKHIQDLGYDTNIVVANTLLSTYAKCGSMTRAREVFDTISHRTVVSWTSLIHGYMENGESRAAMDAYRSMDCQPNHITFVSVVKACGSLGRDSEAERPLWLETGRAIHRTITQLGLGSNIILATTLLDMYSNCGSMFDARETFDGMIHKDVVAWNNLIIGYVENGESSRAVEVFMTMECNPDSVTFVGALKACGCLAEITLGQVVHVRVCRLGVENDQMVANSLVDFYGRCGRMNAAEHVLSRIQCPDLVTWTSLMAGYSMLGDAPHVFHLASVIREAGLQVNSVTLTCVLTACARSGMVEEGKSIFEGLKGRFGVCPGLEHYSCVADMLARANRLDEGLSIINSMPFKPDEVAWTSLLEAGIKWKASKVSKG